jgi:multiple sugar transport system substrate-binding protein
MRGNPLAGIISGFALVGLAAAGCTSGGDGGPTEIVMWTHSAGNEEELATIDEIIADFNASQDEYEVVQEAFPQGGYNEAVTAAAVSGDLPCLLDMDAPVVPDWAWAGYVAPLDLPAEKTDPLLDSTKSYWNDELYAVGYFDVTVGMISRQSTLESHGIRVPTLEEPWTGAEFDAAMTALAESGEYQYPLDLGTGWTGEWWSYAFSPLLQGFGGDLVDRETYLTAEGALNGPEAQAWGEWFQGLFESGYVDPQGSEGREAFLEGTAAITWDGTWSVPAAMEVYDDVVVLPPPDFGAGTFSGAGSWQWGVSATCEDTEGAQAYLEFSLDPEYIARFSDRIGLIPASAEAAALSEDYSEGGDLAFLYGFAEALAHERPVTPAYSVISSVFEKTAHDIMNGADVGEALDQAVAEIDANIESNDGYGFQ